MKELFVINIGRQLGSGGRAVGEIISRRLGIRLHAKELLTLAPQPSGLRPACLGKGDEQPGRGRFAPTIAYLRSPFGADMSSVNNVLSNDALFKVQSDVIRDLASRESCIFVGRCADYILRDHPRAVNVFITADDDDRVRRIRTRTGCTEEEARTMMERGDASGADYYNYYSLRTWGAAATYQLCVNTAPLGDEAAAEFIPEFAARELDMTC